MKLDYTFYRVGGSRLFCEQKNYPEVVSIEKASDPLLPCLALLSVLVFVPVSRALAEKPAGNLTPEQEGVKLTVTIEGPGEAKWLFRGKSFGSGHTLADIPDGKYTVAFTDVPGWDKPADAELSMTKGHAVSIHGKYIRQLGALAVKMEDCRA